MSTLPEIINTLLHEKEIVVIAIDGRSGAGKSTLADRLAEEHNGDVIRMDHFFLPPGLREEKRINVHYERFLEEVYSFIKEYMSLFTANAVHSNNDIHKSQEKRFGTCTTRDFTHNARKTPRGTVAVRNNGPLLLSYRIFDCARMDYHGTQKIAVKPLIIIEGAYSLLPMWDEIYDLRIFYDIDELKQKERIISRNGVDGYQIFKEKWIPREEAYFREYRVRERCDVVLSS
ncbi:MAG: hypothetical protein FWE14_01990 [Lachnospiraceae bacterium]|nr:hypothetical protein [Lachnospiraceae bacterium]